MSVFNANVFIMFSQHNDKPRRERKRGKAIA